MSVCLCTLSCLFHFPPAVGLSDAEDWLELDDRQIKVMPPVKSLEAGPLLGHAEAAVPELRPAVKPRLIPEVVPEPQRLKAPIMPKPPVKVGKASEHIVRESYYSIAEQ